MCPEPAERVQPLDTPTPLRYNLLGKILLSGEAALRVNTRFFAIYRERAGLKEENIDLDEGATSARLVERLSQLHSGLFEGSGRLVVAVNGEYVPMDHVLADGDEVALIPPVSGGLT